MHKLLLSISTVFIGMFLQAQTTIGNANMEVWTDVGTNKEEPQNFNSIKNGSGNGTAISFAPQSCFRESNNPHQGTYCARITTGSALGQAAPGSMTNGRVFVPSLTASEGYIRTVPGDPLYSMPFVGRPDSLVVWYRYTRQGSDNPSITALLHVGNAYLPEAPVNGNHPDSSVNIIARAVWNGPGATVSGWTRISIPFVYVDGRTPQYILITLTSTANSGGTSGSTLWVDDFEVIYNPTVAVGTVNAGPYYVSASTGASLSVPFTLTGTFNAGNTVTAQLSDASGSFTAPVTIGSTTATASGTISATIPAGTASGTGYRVRVVTSNPTLTSAVNGSNITVNLVSNSVAPTAVQTIPVNTNGTVLTATESAGATAREWKYATASGGPYASFSPAQTGTSYTPNFAATGSYYIVLVTTYPGGLNVNSNEVRVNVVSSSVAPTTAQVIRVNTNGTAITVSEQPTATSREWKYATAPGGPYVSFSPAQTGGSYTPNFSSTGVYYVVCVSNYSGTFITTNEVAVTVVDNPIAPTSAQTIATNTAGTQLTVTESTLATSREWKYATVSGGPYLSFSPVQTSANYTPNFSTAGTYFVVCGSTFGSLSIVSNEVTVNVVGNSIAPNTAQSILVGVDGNDLTVTETPIGIQREWLYATTSGGPYSAFSPAETAANYTPNFSSSGSYYVVCRSVISGVTVTSNEVLISVGNATITTGSVNGSPFEFSASAPNASVSVPFTTNGVFNSGNTFTAQLSDVVGSFASPTNIGSVSGTTSGTISATIPANTPAGTAYRIRVIASDPVVFGSDNGSNLIVDQFNNSVAPAATQAIEVNSNGTSLTVTESQAATREWKYTTTSGSGYVAFSPAQTGSSYVPNFSAPGTYYVVAASTNQYNDEVTSNEVQIDVTNGTTLTTLSASGSPFYVSPSANVSSVVTFTSSAVFNSNNIFTVELSDASGSFASPVVLGTSATSTIAPITVTIPGNTATGNGYRVRVTSSSPALIGTDNGTDLFIDQFSNSVSPSATQTITYGTNGTALSVTASQTSTQEWKYSTTSGSGYASFSPAQTGSSYTPNFSTPGTYYVVAVSTNQYSDAVTSNEVMIVVQNGSNLTTTTVSGSPYLVSASANVNATVNFTSNIIFDAANVFTAQLSDASGSFANPVNIGTLNGTSPASISVTIPNSTPSGTGYRARVISSSPAVTGTDNGTNLTVVQFEVGLLPSDTQFLATNATGTLINAQSTHPATYKWKYSDVAGANYTFFNPAVTTSSYAPRFTIPGVYYVACDITNQWSDVAGTQDVVVLVGMSGLGNEVLDHVKAWLANGSLFIDAGNAADALTVKLYDLNGRLIAEQKELKGTITQVPVAISNGLYILQVSNGQKTMNVRLANY